MKWRQAPTGETTTMEDHRRYPGARTVVLCGLCGWTKGYDSERVIDRLRALNAGGPKTPVRQVARRVAWNCPGCGRVKWKTDFAWPPGMDEREIKRLANLYRN